MNKMLIAGLIVVSASAAVAEPRKLNVDFGFFPKGTAGKVSGSSGKISLKTGKEIEFKVRGDTGNVSFHCTQPDGRRFSVATGPLLPQGSPSLVAIQINQDNRAHVLWKDGSLRKQTYSEVLNWH